MISKYTIHLQADGETKLCINNLISDHFYYTDKKLTNFLVSVWYVLKLLFFSVSLIVVDISSLYLATLWLGKYPLLFTYFSGNNCEIWSFVGHNLQKYVMRVHT